MKLVEATEEIPNTESWRPCYTLKIIKTTFNEVKRVLAALDKVPDLTDLVDEFYTQQYDNGIHYIINADKLSYNVNMASRQMYWASRLLDRNEVFWYNYRNPGRSSNDSNPIWRASKSYPNGRYIKKVTNLEEYLILTSYAYQLVTELVIGRGITDEFEREIEKVLRYLSNAVDLIDKFVSESEKYKKLLKSKNH